MHVENIEETEKARPKWDSDLSNNLREVTNEDNERRIRASLKVLRALRGPQKENTTLTRLVRGTGASMTNSKIGFFTLLSGYLLECGQSVSCTDIFAVMDQELKVTNKAKTRETADAFVGRVLTITAMIRQNMLQSASVEDLRQCIKIVVETTKLKAYHSKLAYNALIALVQSDISDRNVQKCLIAVMRSDLKLTWNEHTMSSLHFMMELKWKFPKLINDKILKESFSFAEILSPENFEHVYRVFWHEQNESSIMQPSYDALAKYIAKSSHLVEFANYVTVKLDEANSRNKEVITVKVMTEIINHLPQADVLPKVLVNKFWKVVFLSAKKVKPTDEILRAVYLEFFEAIFNVISKADKKLQYKIIRTLLMSPGTINVDKYPVTNRIVARSINFLDEDVLCQLIELMQNIITDEEPKGGNSEQWLYTEKVTALSYLQKMLHNKKVNIEQKNKSLNWLATLGLFEDPDSTVNTELGQQIKRLFYKTLESPSIKINEEKKLLLDLVAFIEKKRSKNGATLRQPLDKPNSKMCSDILKEAQRKDTSDNLVMFHVLLLHMALQLFNDPELAANAIKELYSCMDRATTTSLRRKNKRAEVNGEPEWTEVMVDLILHLLSQNSAILRKVVKKVFPNICGQLNLSAVHQILSLLDMNEENPLTDQSLVENGDEEEEEEDDDDDDDEESDKDSEDEELEDVDEGMDDENDATVSDQLRNAISVALMASHNQEDDDKDSIDLDEMTEEEGQRLDEVLGNAFKMMGNRGGKGKTKTEKMESTALLHFRNRVIDLLIIYLKSGPQLVVVVEILSVLYRMLDRFSEDDAAELALFKKVQEAIDVAVGTKLTPDITTLSMDDLVTYLRTFISKCTNPRGVEERSVVLQKIVRFFTHIDEHLADDQRKATDGSLVDVLGEELRSFLTQRAPVIGLNIFQQILQGTWKGIWNQVLVILDHGISKENRVFKRVQSLELLRSFQFNTRFIKMADEKDCKKHMSKVHSALESYASRVNGQITPKEFKSYIQLLLDIRLFYNRNSTSKCYLNWQNLQSSIQTLRSAVSVDPQAQAVYSKLCKIVGWEVVRDNPKPAENGHANDGAEANKMNGDTTKKRKNPTHSNLKEKKLKKAKRFQVSSGLDETIHFTNMS